MTPTTKINYKFREHVHEVHRKDSLGLRSEELPPTRARPARCWIDAGVMQDLPHRGGGDAMAEADQFALHPPVSPGGILGSHADNQVSDRRGGRWTSRPAACAVVPLPRDQPAVPGQDRGRGDREDLGPAATRQQPGQRSQPRPIRGRVADPRDLPAQHSVLVPQHQQLGILAQVSPHQHGGQTEQTT
jgi:hypothetical protein